MTDADETRRSALRWTGVCLDCADADELADFYHRLLGWEVARSDGAGWVAMRAPAGGLDLLIQAEPWYEPPTWPEEPGRQAKMLHFEIEVDDLDAAVAHAVLGLVVGQPRAGHPFCLFAG